MAWTKTKTVVVAIAIVLATAGTLFVGVKVFQAARARIVPVYKPIPDNEPQIAERIRNLKLQEFRADECTPEYWQELQRKKNPALEKALSQALGELKTITLVERTEHDGRQSYRYRIAYTKMNVIYHIEFERGKIALAEGAPE